LNPTRNHLIGVDRHTEGNGDPLAIAHPDARDQFRDAATEFGL
jgi:hypothetical protein